MQGLDNPGTPVSDEHQTGMNPPVPATNNSPLQETQGHEDPRADEQNPPQQPAKVNSALHGIASASMFFSYADCKCTAASCVVN